MWRSILMVWDTILNTHQMSLSVAGCAFCDWPVSICPPSLKYSNTLHAKFGVSTLVYINHCLLLYICSVSLKPSRPTILYFVLYIVFQQSFSFTYLRRWEGGFLMDVGTSLNSMEGHVILLLLSLVYSHMPMILSIHFFDIQAYLEHEDVKKFNLGAALSVLCYIIAHSSNSTLLVFLDPPECLLHINYLQNMITALL